MPFLCLSVNLAFSFDRRLSCFCQRTGGDCGLKFVGVTSEAMHAPLSSSADRLTRSRFSDWPLAVKSILGFWFFYALTIVARALLGSDPLTMLSNKMLTILAGIVLTGLVYAAIVLISGRGSVRKQAITAGLVVLRLPVGEWRAC